MREATGADAFAQMRDRSGVADEIGEGHEMRLAGKRRKLVMIRVSVGSAATRTEPEPGFCNV
jgi:hypothetical protein